LNYQVIKSYRPEENKPWVAAAGEEVRYERKSTKYSGWLWCTNREGQSAWAPENWVTIISSEFCRFTRNYNALELAVETGRKVEGIIIESGWVLAIDANKKSGWVPLECLEKLIDL
jgi:hypothetical protein